MSLAINGDIKAEYLKLMVMCNVNPSSYNKTEEMHCDSMYTFIPVNPALEKLSNTTRSRIPAVHPVVLKNINTNFLDTPGPPRKWKLLPAPTRMRS